MTDERKPGQDAAREHSFCSTAHPHEPTIPPTYDADGRCLICCMLIEIGTATAALAESKHNEQHAASQVIEWSQIATEEKKRADALALALQEWQGKAEKVCEAVGRDYVALGAHAFASKYHTQDISLAIERDIRALDPPSRERGEELLRDAERYRAARDATNFYPTPFIAIRHPNQVVSQLTGEYADAAIDAAIKERRK